MNKIEKLLKEYDQSKLQRADLEKELDQLLKDQKRLTDEAEAAADAGDVALYREKLDAAKNMEDTYHVRSRQLSKLKYQTNEAEAKAAWKEYAEEYKKSFVKSWAAYEKMREELYKAYLDMVNNQNEAFRLRERCAECIGLEWSYEPAHNLDKAFPLALLPDEQKAVGMMLLRTPDTDFFFQIFGTKDLDILNRVVRLHASL